MAREIWLDRQDGATRAALVEDGRLTDLMAERPDRRSRLGAVHLGRVAKLLPGIGAAFVDIGESRAGFLPLKEAAGARVGHVLPVQVRADATRDKGPALGTEISLAGRFLVHVPAGERVSVSRRIGDEAGRARLKERIRAIGLGGGWVVRASAQDAPAEALEAEAEYLYGRGRDLSARALGSEVGPILDAPSVAERALVEWGGQGIGRIRVEGAELAESLRRWCAEAAPDLRPRLEPHGDPLPLFEEHDVEGQIDTLLRRRVAIEGGGWLSVEPTEALVSIDVNAGDRPSALDTNLSAAREVARQLRLRNLGGIVVVDFINMPDRRDQARLLDALRQAVADDPAGTHIHGMTALGLVEMTRARRGPTLAEALGRKPGRDSDE